MKKIYLVGLAFALLTASCDDVLEKTSSTQLPTIDAISSVADLTNAVNGVYEQQVISRITEELVIEADDLLILFGKMELLNKIANI